MKKTGVLSKDTEWQTQDSRLLNQYSFCSKQPAHFEPVVRIMEKKQKGRELSNY